MAGTTDIFIQTPKSRKHKTEEPLTATLKYQLQERIVNKEVNFSLKQKKSNLWYEYVYYYRIKHCQQDEERTKIDKHHKLEERRTCVLINIKMLNKNLDVTSRIKANEEDCITAEAPVSEKADNDVIKRYHIEIKFTKPASIFCWNKKLKATVKVHPTVVLPFQDDLFMSVLDKTMTQLFSLKKYEINVKAEVQKGFSTPSKDINVSFVVANNTDITISLRTVSIET